MDFRRPERECVPTQTMTAAASTLDPLPAQVASLNAVSMNTVLIPIPVHLIFDWSSFHAVFAKELGFPDYYGANMNAWIDCMSYADDPQSGLMARAVQPGEILTLQIDDASNFAIRCPEQYRALIDCAAFVNYRRVERGSRPVLALLISGIFL